jgi:hypothetical protein
VRARAGLAAAPALLAAAIGLAGAGGSDADALAQKVLHRQQGISATRATELLGPAAASAVKGDVATLTWGAAADPCVLTADFKDDKMTAVRFASPAAFDAKACRTRARPLLDAAPAPGSPLAAASPVSLTALTNDDIVAMVKEGRSAQAIIARIKNEPCHFDVTLDGTMKLRRAGVGDAIIEAMTDRGCH